MKIVEEWEDGNCKVVIKAKFVSNGIDTGTWNYDIQDVVRFLATMSYEGKVLEEYGDEAHKKRLYEKRFLRPRIYPLTLEETYSRVLEDLKESCLSRVERHKQSLIIAQSDQEITDGLPDSLKGL